MCSRDGKPWKCGEQAALALEEMMKGKKIVCKAVDLDRNGLYRSICFLTFADRPKVEDIGARMVRQGWALAYRKDSVAYVDEEDEARKAKRGIWAGEFISPWEWRAQQREGATSAPKPQLR